MHDHVFHGAGEGVWPDLAMIVKAYFDDSGDDKKQRFAAVGGLIGVSPQWSIFETRWACDTYGLKGPFHSTDCEAQRGCCEGWTVSKTSALMKRLTNTILDSDLRAFGSIVPIADYRAVFPGSSKDDPYCLAIKHTIINMAYLGRMLSRNPEFSSMTIVHEEGSNSDALYKIYLAMKGLSSWKDARYLDGFTFGSKRFSGLQAADLIAREAFKHADNLGIRKIRKPLATLKGQTSLHFWDRQCLEYLRGKGGQENLEALTGWSTSKDAPRMVNLYAEGFDKKC